LYIDGVIRAGTFAKPRAARANHYSTFVEADSLHKPLRFLPCLPSPEFIREAGREASTDNVVKEKYSLSRLLARTFA